MGKSNEYKEASAAQTQAIADYKKANEEAYKRSQGYVGDEGYDRSLRKGAEGAQKASEGAVGLATGAARGAGLTPAQAAMMGGQQAAQAYGQNFQNQQTAAYNSGLDVVNTEQARLAGVGNVANLRSVDAAAKRDERSQNYEQGMGVAGQVTGAASAGAGIAAAFSDSRLKKYIKGDNK